MANRPARREEAQTLLPEPVCAAVDAALERKAFDVVVLDLRKSGAFTDYLILCSGQNRRQVQAIVDAILEQLRDLEKRPSHVEGYQNAEWVLIDSFDFIVHVFVESTRCFYELERLWGSAVRLEFSDACGVGEVTVIASDG